MAWHNAEREGGKLTVQVSKTDHTINCIIEDDGVGRNVSRQNKFSDKEPVHESKGEHLIQARLDLDKLLTERKASINIIDKKNSNDLSSGTTVILSFEEY